MSGRPDSRERQLSDDKQTLLALRRLKARVEALESARTEPIACIGVGCRFPGGIDSAAAFWDLLENGRSAIIEVPADRWNIEEFYDPDPDAPGKMSTRWGGFLERVDLFDAKFFGITPREAAGMDPQQRLLLEVAWEALEHAGENPARLAGTRTGVFVGISTNDYLQLHLASQSASDIDAYFGSGTSHSIASGRLSYFLGLRGPSLSIDTACSSSLVAVHEACQALRNEECRLAIAGGVNVILSPEGTINLSKAHMMASDGRCKTFDASADGFVRGEGCGIVVLKRLSHALADGNRILALVRGSAVNQDGRSNGLTAPNELAQEEVIRDALERCGLNGHQIDYVEAHGTGTALGDPIEVQALAAALNAGRDKSRPVYLGSVKTNFGHLEAAAGIAGLIKVVLALQYKRIPAHLNLERRSPYIPWEELPVRFEIPHSPRPWDSAGTRFAGVSSFGFSGTNAHVILEQAPQEPPRAEPSDDAPDYALLPVSAADTAALHALAGRYQRSLLSEAAGWQDACFTAAVGRSHFEHRSSLVARTVSEALPFLGDIERAARDSAAVAIGRAGGSGPPKIAFLFTGQGAQYPGMGKRLYESTPLYREILDRCDGILKPELEASLLSVMFDAAGDGAALNETRFTQPALFVLEYALAMLWRSLGIRPFFALGHSIGEYSAAAVAGVLQLEDALTLVARRARLMQSLPAGGSMAAVLADRNMVEAALGNAGNVVIAAVNGPGSVVVSGPDGELGPFERRMEARGMRVERLAVSHAFHSPLMEPILDELETAARVAHRAPEFGLVSNLTGRAVTEGGVYGPGHWRRQARETVDFYRGMQTLVEQGCEIFLEVGPSPVLAGMGRECVAGGSFDWLASLRRGRDDRQQLLETLGALYVRGADVDWNALYPKDANRRVSLPTYPFQRERFWLRGTPPRRSAAAPGEPAAARSGLLYELAWRSLPREAADNAAAQGASTAGVAASLGESWFARARECGLGLYDALLPELNALCTGLILDALRPIEPMLRAPRGSGLAQLADGLEVVGEQKALFRRLLQILEEDGYVAAEDGRWTLRREFGDEQAEGRLRSCRRRFPESAELELLERCGPRLRDVLQGRCNPLTLLFPDGSTELAERLYQKSPFAVAYNSALAEAVIRLLEGLGGRVRILEVGAGTGGTSSHLLPRLEGRPVEYVFTDVSPLFVNRARKKYAAHSFVEYRVFDLEQDPLQQGFESGSFDLIVAANVVHATRRVKDSLEHLHALLRPRGALVLLEGNAPQRFGDLTVGLTEGWWRFADAPLRVDYPLLSRAAWRELLESAGFGEVAAVPGGIEGEGLSGISAEHAILVARTARAAAETARRWIVAGPDAAACAQVAAGLGARGEDCVVVPGAALAQHDRLGRFRDTLAAQPGELSLEVLYLAYGNRADDAASSGLRTGLDAAFDVVALCRSLSDSARPGGRRLRVVTQGAEACLADEVPALSGALLWGLGRVMALEQPDLWGGLIDLEPTTATPDPASLVAELLSPGHEDQVALRGTARYVPRLARLDDHPGEGPPAISADATYLVTGGLGDLGPRIARWLIRRGARSLVLTSRTSLPERRGSAPLDERARRRVGTVEALQALGAEIEVVACDAGDEPAMQALIERLLKRERPLRGIIHAAGQSFLKPCIELDRAALEAAWSAKAAGGLAIHRAVQGAPLDFVVYFSSAAAVWGSAGLAHYAAANRLLDALAVAGRRRGVPALSINWARWGTAIAELEAYFDRIGLEVMEEGAALGAMETLLAAGKANAVVAAVDWERFRAVYSARRRRPLLDELESGPPARTEPQPAVDWREALVSILPSERRAWLLERVRSEVGRTIGLASPAGLDPEQGFFDLGMDSLMAVELKKRLESATGRSLATSLTFDYPTVAALAGYLATEVFAIDEPRAAEAPPAPPEDSATLLDRIEQLSDEDVERLLYSGGAGRD